MIRPLAPALCALPILLSSTGARAQQLPEDLSGPQNESKLTVGGYVEAYYAYNFNRPSNRITEFRAFDNRHNTFALQSAVLDASWANRHLEARLALQFGLATETYYRASEPSLPGASLTPSSGPDFFRHIQQAYLGWKAIPEVLTVQAGLFLSPVGPESMATHDNWTWSHSMLFFGLPFYHAGARARWQINRKQALRLGVYNGWNDALDNNSEKTLGIEYNYDPSEELALGVVYVSGVERPDGAIEGRAWRHLLDLYAVWSPLERVALLAHADAGAEPNALGFSGWVAGDVRARVKLSRRFFFAVRGTTFLEQRAEKDGVTAAPIAIPAARMYSGSLTLEARPREQLSFKLEGRHDRASAPVFFSGRVAGDGSTTPFLPNARAQTTVTLGATAWF